MLDERQERELRKIFKGDVTPYEDLLTMPHPVSGRHPQMPLQDRAAQFAPFAALTGYGEAAEETARRQEERELENRNEVFEELP